MTKYKINPSKTEQNEVLQDEKLEQNTFYLPRQNAYFILKMP